MMNAIIRQAAAQDIPSLQTLFTEVDNYHADHVPAFFRHVDTPTRPNGIIAQWLDVNDAAILVAEVNGDVVGLVHVTAREAPEHPVLQPRRFAHVSDMIVHESFRGKGIGNLLLDAAENWAREMGLAEIELSVWAFNESAVALYRKSEFETLSMRMGKRLE